MKGGEVRSSRDQLRLDLSTTSNRETAPDSGGSRGALEDARLIELLADRLYEGLVRRLEAASTTGSAELLDACEVARLLGCERGWVYEHKAELGVVRLGAGMRPRLRFPRERIEAIVRSGPGRVQARPDAQGPGRSRTTRTAAIPLLEIKERAR
jgi:hypothetical protein